MLHKFYATVVIVVLMCSLLPPSHVTADGGMRLYIPRIAMDVPVGECALVNGWHDLTELGNDICHLEGTADIDFDWARMVLAGHTPGGFSDLVLLELGDDVLVWNDGAIELYHIALITVTTVDDTQWLMPTTEETLTLITCHGDERLIIFAERVYARN